MKANLPKGMGGAQNMQSMLRQAQKMQEQMATLQEELDAKEYEIKAIKTLRNLRGVVLGYRIVAAGGS